MCKGSGNVCIYNKRPPHGIYLRCSHFSCTSFVVVAQPPHSTDTIRIIEMYIYSYLHIVQVLHSVTLGGIGGMKHTYHIVLPIFIIYLNFIEILLDEKLRSLNCIVFTSFWSRRPHNYAIYIWPMNGHCSQITIFVTTLEQFNN